MTTIRTPSVESLLPLYRQVGVLSRKAAIPAIDRHDALEEFDGPFIATTENVILAATISQDEITPAVGNARVFRWDEENGKWEREADDEEIRNYGLAALPQSTATVVRPFKVWREASSGHLVARGFDTLHYGKTTEIIPAGGSGQVDNVDGVALATATVTLTPPHGGEDVPANTWVKYQERMDGTNWIIVADCDPS